MIKSRHTGESARLKRLRTPHGTERDVQVIPTGDPAAKDEFMSMTGVIRDDILTERQVPPVLVGTVVPVVYYFGNRAEVADVIHFAEIGPLQATMRTFNDWLSAEAIVFLAHGRQAGMVA